MALIITLTIYLSFRYVPIFALTKSFLQTVTDRECNNGISAKECLCQWNGLLIYEMDGGQKKIIATINLQTAAPQQWTMKPMNGDRIAKMEKIYIPILNLFTPERSAYIGVYGHLLGWRRFFHPVFRELRCLRHKIHIGLFVTVGIADLTWLLTASLQVIGNVFAGERFQLNFPSIGTSPGLKKRNCGSVFKWCRTWHYLTFSVC